MMIWEYKTLTLPSSVERQSMLSEMGLNGWELVGFEQGLAYFKREKKPNDASFTAALDAIETKRLTDGWVESFIADPSGPQKKPSKKK